MLRVHFAKRVEVVETLDYFDDEDINEVEYIDEGSGEESANYINIEINDDFAEEVDEEIAEEEDEEDRDLAEICFVEWGFCVLCSLFIVLCFLVCALIIYELF